MARRPLRTAVILVALASAVLWFVRDRGGSASLDGGEPGLLADRIWLQALPTEKTDHVHALLVLADAPFGVFQRASAYQATIEVFEHEDDNGRLGLRFPQSDKRTTLRYRAAACEGHAPFDLCLELSENPWDGPTRYYGFRDEAAAGAKIAALRHRLAHAAIDGP